MSSGVHLSNELTARWAETVPGTKSTVISGVSVWPLLAYLSTAADGDAAEQLRAAAGTPGADAATEADDLLHTLAGSAAIHMATGLWLESTIETTEWWKQHASAIPVERLPDDPARAQMMLDEWVRKTTDGLIETMPMAIDEQTMLALASAFSVRTKWIIRFRQAEFKGNEQSVWAGMRIQGLKREELNWSSVKSLSTEGGPITLYTVQGENGIAVDVAMGATNRKASEVLAHAIRFDVNSGDAVDTTQFTTRDDLPGVTVGLPSHDGTPRLYVSLPRFDISSEHDLTQHADVFGIMAACDAQQGHFPKLSAYPLAIKAARQHATASFTEEGFVAAAVTAMDFMGGGMTPPPESESIGVTFDRPFAFVARDQKPAWCSLPDGSMRSSSHRPGQRKTLTKRTFGPSSSTPALSIM